MVSSSGRRRLSGRWRILIAVILIIIFYTAGGILFGWLRPSLIFLFKPLWSSGQYLAEFADRWRQQFQSNQTLITKNVALTEKVRQLEAQLVSYRSLTEENRHLKEILGREDAAIPPLIASILAPAVDFPYGIILLDLGRKNATRPLTVGDQVRVEGKIIIGRVVNVDDNSSQVRLLSANDQITPVVVGVENLAAEAHGLGGGNFSISLPRGLSIAEGELVRMTNSGEELIVGTVTETISRPSDPFQKIIFKSPININELKEVEIYTN